MTKTAFDQGRIQYFQQDGSREFISLLACVCADGSALPPALIYQGASNDLQSSWIEDLNETNEAYFTSSANGWTCDALGLAWLRLFDRHTRVKGSRRRLLILDGHSSHINWAFVMLADSLRILIAVLPPHTTHRLQPLDVGLFSPLAQAYTKRLDAYTHGGLGWVSMTKRMFWPIFKAAWEASFTTKNIIKAFEKTGIWPLQPLKTIQQLQKPISTLSPPSKLSSIPIKTPQTARAIRRLCKASPSLQKAVILERAVFRLATKFELQSHENMSLRQALMEEKRRRVRGKRLNLLGEEVTNQPQFFSPSKIITARTYQESKEAAEQEEKRQKALRKEEAARKRQELQAKKQEAILQRQMRKEANWEAKVAEKTQKAAEKAEKRLQREQDKQQKALATLQRKKEQQERKQLAVAVQAVAVSKRRPRRVSIPARKPPITRKKPQKTTATLATDAQRSPPHSIEAAISTATDAVDDAVAEVQITSRRGRIVTMPQRFKE